MDKLTPSVRRILKVYRSATSEQKAEGMGWYNEAHALAVELDPENVPRAAGIIAAYSPLTEWSENVRLARMAYQGVFRGHVMASQVKRIYEGEHYWSVLKGNKTFNFASLIADPTNPNPVVIDRHAFSIAVGRLTTEQEQNTLQRKGVYDEFADAYRRAAKIEKITAAQMQAVTWVVWRETKIRTQAAMRLKAGR
jgi:hypothetical protein